MQDDIEVLDVILERVRERGQAVPKVAIAISSWVADYLDLLVADLDRELDSNDGLLNAMIRNCPSLENHP